jgi:hypothetical protein
MKSKKFILLSACLLTLTFNSFSQAIQIIGGVNFANMLIKDNDGITSEDMKLKPGIQAGVSVEYPLLDNLFLESGLLFLTKGVKYHSKGEFLGYNYEGTTKMNLQYLDIPINLKTYFDVSNNKVFITTGPYIGIGINGNYTIEYSINGETEKDKEKIEWGTDKNSDELKRLDYGLYLGTGIEIANLQLELGYSLGLANISPYTGEGTKISNRYFGAKAGIKLK